jgi:transposase
VRVVEDLDWLACKWKNLACLIEVRSTRQKIGEEASEVFRRFYISSRLWQKIFLIRQQWSIEESFRVAKSTLKTRPIFHWAPHRIKSHVLLCFINLFLERFLELLLRRKNLKLTPDRIRQALSHTITFEDKLTKRQGIMESGLSEDAEKIFQTLGISTKRKTASII